MAETFLQKRRKVQFGSVRASEMLALPPILYHGTECTNVDSICEKGILVGTPETCNPHSKEDSLGGSHIEDCIGNVSMATDPKDAVFFVVASRKSREEFLRPQCIFEVRTMFLDHEKLLFRELMDKPLSEAKYYGRIPPAALVGYLERSFTEDEKGRLKVKEEFKYCPLKPLEGH